MLEISFWAGYLRAAAARLRADDEGASVVRYGVLVSLVATATVVLLGAALRLARPA